MLLFKLSIIGILIGCFVDADNSEISQNQYRLNSEIRILGEQLLDEFPQFAKTLRSSMIGKHLFSRGFLDDMLQTNSADGLFRVIAVLTEVLKHMYEQYHKCRDAQYLKGATKVPIARTDCADLRRKGITKDGVYTVKPKQSKPFKVYCDMTTGGGGWTVLQKRFDGSVNFYLNWAAYKKGFGDLRGEFWLGNDKIHILTKQKRYELRIDLQDKTGLAKYAVYNPFSISSESDKYRLSVGSYKGTAGDSLSNHNGMAFTTKDRDNDRSSGNCAVGHTGAWWYKSCAYSNLNGQYNPGKNSWRYMVWYNFSNQAVGLKTSVMMIRPVK